MSQTIGEGPHAYVCARRGCSQAGLEVRSTASPAEWQRVAGHAMRCAVCWRPMRVVGQVQASGEVRRYANGQASLHLVLAAAAVGMAVPLVIDALAHGPAHTLAWFLVRVLG